jgi:hypothetical protein
MTRELGISLKNISAANLIHLSKTSIMKNHPAYLLEQYIIGKDQDKYQILETIYAESAEVEFEINSSHITFPSKIVGRKEIAKVLSAEFNKKYEKVKTYYLTKNISNSYSILKQNWLVVMKSIGEEVTRVGTGFYNWEFREYNKELRIENHKIYIHTMLEIEDHASKQLEDIQGKLEYPWIERPISVNLLKDYKNLDEVTGYLVKQDR